MWEKEKILITSIFSFSHTVFYPSKNLNHYLSHIYVTVCKYFQFGRVQIFIFQ